MVNNNWTILSSATALFLTAAITTISLPTFAFSASVTNGNTNNNIVKQQAHEAEDTCVNSNIMPKYRSVKRVMEKPYQHWVGDGFHVYPVFADLAFKEDLSPLLMFDYAAPKKFNSKVGNPRGVGEFGISSINRMDSLFNLGRNKNKCFCTHPFISPTPLTLFNFRTPSSSRI